MGESFAFTVARSYQTDLESPMTTLAKSLNGDGRHGLALLLIVIALLALSAGGDAARAALEWRRSDIADGQWWRLLTGHVVHLDVRHAVLNATGLVLVWALYARAWSPRQWLAVSAVAIASIDAGLWWFVPSLEWYVGASGLLHGLIAAGVVSQLRSERGIAIVVGVLLAAKLASEQLHGPLPFTDARQHVVIESHAFGALGGLLAGAGLALRRKRLAGERL